MKRLGRKIASLSCVIVLLAGSACACRFKESPPTTNENDANMKLINNTIDDFFAYVKIADTKRIPAYFENSTESEKTISHAYENAGEKAFEVWCNKIHAEAKITGIGAKAADVELTITCRDDAAILENAPEDGAFADAGKLSDAIRSAPFSTKTIKVGFVKKETWVFDEASTEELLDVLFGFLQTDGLIAQPEESSTGKNEVPISVYDAYWVDTKGEETGGYHCSTKNICLYVYTWNTYSNVDIKYEYMDSSGNILYTNSFLIKNNTDWIACAWKPANVLPAGDIYCRLYEPSGEEFHTSKVTIFNDGEIIPFPITWMETSGWVDSNEKPVEYYTENDAAFEYRGYSLKTYQELSLKYRFVDDDGNVLYEDKMEIGQETDAFRFCMELPEGYTIYPEETGETTEEPTRKTSVAEEPTDPTEPAEPKHITLIVETKDGQPFLQSTVEIRKADASIIPDETEMPSETSAA